MYNIAKVAKGEILIYFNSIFDQLCKVSQRAHPLSANDLALTHSLPLAWRGLGTFSQERS